MKEFSDSLPNSELEHFWLNMFNFFRKYICVYAFKLNKLNEEENDRATYNFQFSSPLHFVRWKEKYRSWAECRKINYLLT